MDEKRIFYTNGRVGTEELSRLLEQFLNVNKKLRTQRFDFNRQIVLQCIDADSNWKQFVGLDAALTITLEETENETITVTIGNGKWLDKVGVAAAGAIFFSPLIVAAGIGAVRQAILPTEIFNFIESNLNTGTAENRTSYAYEKPAEPASNEEESGSVCPCCGSAVSENQAYCSKCGTKL